MSWRKFLLVLRKILRQFVNTLSADDKYSLLNRDNLSATNLDTINSETTSFLSISLWNFEIYIKF